MNPRVWAILTLCLTFGLLAGSQPVDAAARPNVILLMGDDHGWDETGYNGHPHLQTPVLDDMASHGLRLDHFYAAHPTCSPTRGSIVTGRHPNRYGTFSPNRSIRPEEISVAQLLGQSGYACAHFGKWHLGPVKADSPTNPGAMGFDEWLSHDNFFEMNPQLSRNGGPPERIPGESSEILVREAIQFMSRQVSKERPFFVVIWYGSPHEPYSGLEQDLQLYKDLPARYSGKMTQLTSNKTGRSTKRPLGEVLQERYAEITAMDRSIGQLRNWLRRTDQHKNTLLWYCGDNGTSRDGIVTSPFRGQKGTVYEGGLRVPGIIEWPERIPQPRTSDVNCVTSDILPTLCELTGISLPDRPLDGISLAPLINGEMTQRNAPIFFWSYAGGSPDQPRRPYIDPELQKGTTPLVKMLAGRYTRNFKNEHHLKITKDDYHGARAMLDGRFKLVIHKNKTELFDLHDDPAEKRNLADSHKERVIAMQQAMRRWQTSVLNSLTEQDY